MFVWSILFLNNGMHVVFQIDQIENISGLMLLFQAILYLTLHVVVGHCRIMLLC
jgi:hypothetical protein